MNKRGTIIVIGVLLILAVCIGILAYCNAPKDDIDSATISIIKNGQCIKVFTMEEIQALPCIEVQKEIVSSNFANDKGLFRGVPLRVLLDAVDESLLTDSTQIIARAEDAFVTSYSADEVAESDNIFIAYSKDGESLGTMDNSGSGPFRIVITEDEFGNRSTKYLYEIEVQ